MSWVTIIWSMSASASLMLAAMHLLIWCKKRTAWVNLLFSLTAMGSASLAFCELGMMRAQTPEQFGTTLRWFHVPGWVIIVALVGFVLLYLRAGRLWLAWPICGLRTLSLLLNFIFSPNINYREITSLRHIPFLGETVSVAYGVPNPWMLVGQLSLLLLVIFAADATLTAWRRGNRQQALVVGGCVMVCAVAGLGQGVLFFWGIVHAPITASLFYMCIVLVMGYQLSCDVLRAAQLSDDLRESEERMALASEAAGFGVWMWNIARNQVWGSERWLHLFGFAPDATVTFEKVIQRIHPDDREIVEREVRRALADCSDYAGEYRVILPDGTQRWIAARGRMYPNRSGKPVRMLGAALDITERKRAEQALIETGERLVQAAQAAGFGAYQYNFTAREAFYSPESLSLYGLPADATIELDTNFVPLAVHPDDKSLFQSRMQAANDPCGDGTLDVEYRITRSDGQLRWLRMRGRTIFTGHSSIDRPIRTNGIIHDISERKKMEVQLQSRLYEIEELKKQLEQENVYLRTEIKLQVHHKQFVGESAALKQVLNLVELVAPTQSTVLILGETGTGKELIAHAIHDLSPRKNRLMVKVNCASLPPSLVESELFGREAGAYTGAMTKQIGRFELANGSTLFLDEISELPLELQAKLLRVLQEGEFERLGNPKTIRVDVRLITATNRNLWEEVQKGKFREDLYYRLKVFLIEVPPLRKRPEDIPSLVWCFMDEFSRSMGKNIHRIPQGAMKALQAYHWPGNVRELRNLVEQCFIISNGDTLKIQLPQQPSNEVPTPVTLAESEAQHILNALKKSLWHIKGPEGAAQLLGLNPSTLYSKMKKLGIPIQGTKDGISS